MITLLILSIIFGAVVSGLSGIEVLFWIVAVFFFVCGLPFAIVTSFIHGEVDYTQDRADYRQTISDITAMEIAETHEYEEDERINRLVEAVKRKQSKITQNDNRQVNITGIHL